MDVGEIFVSAFISLLLDKVTSGELLKWLHDEGIDAKIKKWSNDLRMFNAVISDAEERQMTDKSVQMWLEELQDLAYDMDDILDELSTQLLHRNSESSSRSKIRKIFHSVFSRFTQSDFVLDKRASGKIDEITARLDELAKRKNALGLTMSVGGRSEGSRATTSVVEESYVLGREQDKAAICKLLLDDRKRNDDGQGRDVCVIPILGMGGLGKTTLAQLVYNDEQVKGRFDHRAWVCIAESFDLLKTSNIICASVAEASEEFKDLNSVQVRLKEKLSNKKFLIVLDDVWDERYAKWDQFRVPFLVGAPESAIIVTTRLGTVAKLMGSMEAYNLKKLHDDDCISLLVQHALSKPNFDKHPDLKETGEEIARKCGGLPLAAKSLGGVLRTKASLGEWKKILSSKIWDLKGNDILPALRLSYLHLPPELKPLFVYCSIFPKDYEFDKDELILLWMAQGLLTQTGRDMKMEELGLEYFNDLLSRSFFNYSGNGKSRFLMHDLINDVAVFVAGKVSFRLDDKIESTALSTFSEKVRHSSFIRQTYGTDGKFSSYSKVLQLRSFLAIDVGSVGYFYLSNKVLNDLIPKLRCLRVLSLSGYRVNELPRSIGDLKHLRFLNMSNTDITHLPESVCELYNLQTLLLRGCDELVELPTSIRDLSNLRHLDIAQTPKLKWMPSGIGMLSSLCTLTKIIIGEGERNGFQLTELKGLSDLKGTLSIFGMHNIKSATEAREANLLGKGGLDKLELRWDENFGNGRDESIEKQVLDVLKPQAGLEQLQIAYYGGTSFPSWVGDRSFSCMVHLTLSGCKKCTALPSLGHLLSLRELIIQRMERVKAVGAEFYGKGSPEVDVFRSLEILSFEQMFSWEEWSSNIVNGEENENTVFPRLCKLNIVGCGELVEVGLPRFPSLEGLKISECSEALLRSMVDLSTVKELEITEITNLTHLDEGIIENCRALEEIKVAKCEALEYLWKEVDWENLNKLRVLEIKECGKLVSLGEKLPHNLERLTLTKCNSLERMPNCCESLQYLDISSCKKLNYLPSTTENNAALSTTGSSNTDEMVGFHKLVSLKISSCPCLTSLPTGKKIPSTLKHLIIYNCKNLVEPGEVQSNEKVWLRNSIPSLEYIYFCDWRNLKPFVEGCFSGFSHLTELWISGCEGIKSIPERCLPTVLRFLVIRDCKNLKSLLLGNYMKSLQNFQITGCENLEKYPREGWPPELEFLRMGDVKQPITEWDMDFPDSLRHLSLVGKFPELVSLSKVGSWFPTSLTRLYLWGFENLESLSYGQRTPLQELVIKECPKLQSLPDMLLPALSKLEIYDNPLMKEKCRKDRRDYWARISHIPCIQIDNELLWGLY